MGDEIPRSLEGDRGGEVDGKPVGAGGDGWKSDGFEAVFLRRPAITLLLLRSLLCLLGALLHGPAAAPERRGGHAAAVHDDSTAARNAD